MIKHIPYYLFIFSPSLSLYMNGIQYLHILANLMSTTEHLCTTTNVNALGFALPIMEPPHFCTGIHVSIPGITLPITERPCFCTRREKMCVQIVEFAPALPLAAPGQEICKFK